MRACFNTFDSFLGGRKSVWSLKGTMEKCHYYNFSALSCVSETQSWTAVALELHMWNVTAASHNEEQPQFFIAAQSELA